MAKDTNDRKTAHSKEYEKLKESLKNRFISSAHIMFGRDVHELPMNERRSRQSPNRSSPKTGLRPTAPTWTGRKSRFTTSRSNS